MADRHQRTFLLLVIRKKLALVIVDDRSNIAVIEVLNKLYELVRKGRKTSKILVDHGPQFRNMFVRGCKELGIEVERCIRTFNERISKARQCIRES